MDRPLVSIIIPCYRGADYLAGAIESCLRQTYRHIEVVVVDDASPDSCAAIAEGYSRSDPRVRLIRHPENGGVSRAFNTGMGAARGDYFTRLAQDDLFEEGAVESMAGHLQRSPGAGLVYCDFQLIDDKGRVTRRVTVPGPAEVLSFRNGLGLCVMWRREVWEKVGGFDPRFDAAEDFEYWLRIARAYPLTKCPGVAPMLFRVHDEMGSSRYFEKQEKATAEVIAICFPKDGSIRNLLRRRKALAHVAFSTSTEFSAAGNQVSALGRLVRSFALWPVPYRPGEQRIPFARLAHFIVYALRFLKAGRGRPTACRRES